MSLQSVIFIIFLEGAVGLFFYKYYPDYGYIALGIAFLLGIIGELSTLSNRKKRSSGKMPSSEKMTKDDGEYHNDFKKVPGGVNNPLPTRPINFLSVDPYKELNDALEEDLKNMGLEDEKTKKKSHSNEI